MRGLWASIAAAFVVASAAAAAEWDLTSLPAYDPAMAVAGTIRVVGSSHAGMMALWEEGFRKHHPGTLFANNLPTSDAAIPALVNGIADLAPDGGEPSLTETLGFYEVYGYHPAAITVATGAYDAEGRTNGIVVYVHADNPLTKLTVDELDGIFGSERVGGLRGFKWTLAEGRGPEKNIRTWEQLGLTGDWAGKTINTYGHAPSGTARFFQRHVLANTDKWNPNLRQFVETGSKMIGEDDRTEQRGGLKHMLANELAKDRYGIAWTVIPQARDVPGLKPLAIARRGSRDYVTPSLESFQDRSYPLTRSIYIFLNRAPGMPLDPKLREFLRYVLSRDGQQIVAASNGHLPLTASVVAEERRKLD